MKPRSKAVVLIVFLSLALLPPLEARAGEDSWTFVSVPDFLNMDIEYPQTGWEDALDYYLDAIKAEDPDFVLFPGDVVRGHWDSTTSDATDGMDADFNNDFDIDVDDLDSWADKYYGAWKDRIEDHGLKYYVALGDHEIGDDPWSATVKANLVDDYKAAFVRNFSDMPKNCDANDGAYEGTTYSFTHKNTLVVVVDEFEYVGGTDKWDAQVTGGNLAWVEDELDNSTVDHKVVVGHCPILGDVLVQSSSNLYVDGREESGLWEAMVDEDVDLYLAGEVHATDVLEADGIVQVTNNAQPSWNTYLDYLVVKVTDDKLDLELKEICIDHSGDGIAQTGPSGGPENITISAANQAAGFQTSGTLVIDKSRDLDRFTNRTGVFQTAYVTSGGFEYYDTPCEQSPNVEDWDGDASVVDSNAIGVPDPPDGSHQWALMEPDDRMYQWVGHVDTDVIYTVSYYAGDRTNTDIMTTLQCSLWADGNSPFTTDGSTRLGDFATATLPGSNGGIKWNSHSFAVIDSSEIGEKLWLKYVADGSTGDRVLLDNVTIDVRSAKGDADLDGFVDATDLATLQDNWTGDGGSGKDWNDGDFDHDDDVDLDDLELLRSHWTDDVYAMVTYNRATGEICIDCENITSLILYGVDSDDDVFDGTDDPNWVWATEDPQSLGVYYDDTDDITGFDCVAAQTWTKYVGNIADTGLNYGDLRFSYTREFACGPSDYDQYQVVDLAVVVVNPEPTSLLMLSLGVAALFKRRSRMANN